MLPQDSDSQEDSLSSFREERLEQRRKRPAILIGVSIGVIIAVAVGWVTFGKYVSVYYGADTGELPVIRADRSADGMMPETPGGMNVPDRDKMVYERLRQSSTDLPVERLLPQPEQPQVPEQPVPAENESGDPIGELAGRMIAEETASAVIYEDDGTPVEVMFRETQTVEIMPAVQTKPAEAPAPEKKAEPDSAAPQKNVKTETAARETKPVKAEPAVPAGSYSVQIVSTRSAKAAESEWGRLSKRFKDIIADLPHNVSEVSTANGTFFRLRAGHFKTHDEAKALCDQLKVRKQECFVVK